MGCNDMIGRDTNYLYELEFLIYVGWSFKTIYLFWSDYVHLQLYKTNSPLCHLSPLTHDLTASLFFNLSIIVVSVKKLISVLAQDIKTVTPECHEY
jgi:hypothetical protein